MSVGPRGCLLLTRDISVGDPISARRRWEQLSRRAEAIPSLARYAEMAHAAYLSLRGDLEAAIELFERILPVLAPRSCVGWSMARACYAATLNQMGAHARAKQLVADTLALTSSEDRKVVGRYLELSLQLALAEAGLGNHEQAVRILDDLLAAHGREHHALLIGLLHKTRAEVALSMNDRKSFDSHLAHSVRFFRATSNPALIAQWERLLERAGRGRVAPEPATATERERKPDWNALSALTDAEERAEHALRVALSRSQSPAGFLFLVAKGGALHLAASSGANDPSASQWEQLQQQVQRARFAATEQTRGQPAAADALACGSNIDEEEEEQTEFVDSVAPPSPEDLYRSAVLATTYNGETVVVGGLIALTPARPLALDVDFLSELAAALYTPSMCTTV